VVLLSRDLKLRFHGFPEPKDLMQEGGRHFGESVGVTSTLLISRGERILQEIFHCVAAAQIQKIVKPKAAARQITLKMRKPFNQDTDSMKSCTGRTATTAVRVKAHFNDRDSELVL